LIIIIFNKMDPLDLILTILIFIIIFLFMYFSFIIVVTIMIVTYRVMFKLLLWLFCIILIVIIKLISSEKHFNVELSNIFLTRLRNYCEQIQPIKKTFNYINKLNKLSNIMNSNKSYYSNLFSRKISYCTKIFENIKKYLFLRNRKKSNNSSKAYFLSFSNLVYSVSLSFKNYLLILVVLIEIFIVIGLRVQKEWDEGYLILI